MKIVLKRAVAVLLANIVYVDGACAYPPDDKGATINYKGVDVIITPDANLTIPSNWTEIPAYAFRSCGDVKKVVIPAAITKILDNAFHGSEIEELSFEKNSQLETISGYVSYFPLHIFFGRARTLRIIFDIFYIFIVSIHRHLFQVIFNQYGFQKVLQRFLVMHSIIHYFSSKCFSSQAAGWKQLVVM